MKEIIVKDGKTLRLGYTTGSCAAAAAKAAAWMLLTGNRKEKISLMTPRGIMLDLDVSNIDMKADSAVCSIQKDSGDDPDITKGMHIFARVSYAGNEDTDSRTDDRVIITGGVGIGTVTKPGLDQPVGNAAINSVPRKMIRENVEEICALADYPGKLSVEIFAPEGEELAKKTFNPRLGIVGGLSILGTTGIVEPMSEQSLIDTIYIELKQRRALGAEYAFITPGNYGMEFIRDEGRLDPAKAVMVSNFIGDALRMCCELEYKGILLVGHIGKLVKLAGGIFNTHSKYGDCRMEILTSYAAAQGLAGEKAGQMLECATCDDALRLLKEWEPQMPGIYEKTLEMLINRIAFQMDQKVFGEVPTGAVLFSREYGFLCRTSNAEAMYDRI